MPAIKKNHAISWSRFYFGIFAVAASAALWGSGGCETNPTGNNGQQMSGPAGSAFPSVDMNTESAAADVARAIEEADVVKVVANKAYILNRYKGLIILDVSNPDAPVMLSTYDLRGRGVELYVVGTQVLAILSADYYYAYAGGAEGMAASSYPIPPSPDFEGSQVAVIDAANPAAPALKGKINLVGFAEQSRRVGDIIYIVGSTFYDHHFNDSSSSSDEGFVASINVADPANILPVQRETFSGLGLHIHTSDTLLLAASSKYDVVAEETNTNVQAIDISDPTGIIVIRGAVLVPGSIRNRFYMDSFNNVLRIATESGGFGFRKVRVFTYDLTDLDNITALGQTEVMQNESLEAVRFDGPRGYVVTFLRTDPLFVLDMQDPANPIVAGALEVPGFSTHIEPRGDRLIAVGIDDTDGNRPAIAYYDVSNPAAPAQLGRVILGPPGSYTDSEATYDEKAFKIVDELGLIAVPFQHVNPAAANGQSVPPSGPDQPASNGASSAPYVPQCVNAVQLVDFNDLALTQRGFFEHSGRVERVGVLGERIFALSQTAFQTVDITNRDTPAPKGSVTFIDANELPYYSDCGYFGGGVVDPGFGVPWLGIFGGMCGGVGLLPLGAMVLWFFGCRVRRRF